MHEVMLIIDKFMLPDLGVVISGVNPNFDTLEKEKIEKLIGKSIVIRKPNGSEATVKVKGVDVASSLLGKKNISIQLGGPIQLEDLEVHSTVYGTGTVWLKESADTTPLK